VRGMMPAVAVLLLSSQSGLANDARRDDPAVLACEALARNGLSGTTVSTFVRGHVTGASVQITYRTEALSGLASRHQRRCSFVYRWPSGAS